MRRALVPLLLLAGCNQHPDEDARLDRMEASLNRIERNQRAQLPAPMSREQFEQMPVGTVFLAPDGSIRRKPAKTAEIRQD